MRYRKVATTEEDDDAQVADESRVVTNDVNRYIPRRRVQCSSLHSLSGHFSACLLSSR